MERPKTREDAKAHISQIRKAKGVDVEPGSAGGITDDLEASLSILSEGLYQQSTRFLMELLQNADDCSYNTTTPTMDVTFRNGGLRVDYNEDGFTMRDVEAICRISSTKKASANQTGEKGIGFKSVFRIADEVLVLSGNYSFQFDARRKLGMITPEWVDFPDGIRPGFTSIILQIRKEEDERELIQEMKSMSPKHIIFLRRLRRINISIATIDGTSWETSLSRKEDEVSHNGSRRTMTLTHNDRTLNYWVYQHVVKGLPPEPKRAHCSKSVIVLAFPVSNTAGSAFDPVAEPQQVHAVLPIRDYGFKFLINADFLLIASRQDINASSPWNKALRDAILDAFWGAIGLLNAGPLRYTWLRYMPTPLTFSDFFQNLGSSLKERLLQNAILESAKGEMVTPLSVCYVSSALKDENNIPLALSATTESKYLSQRYSDADYTCLREIGVRELSENEFLDDLKGLLETNESIASKSVQWHKQVAKVLISMWQKMEQRIRIKRLPLIPLNDGRRVSASMGNIYFPEEKDNASLGDLGVSFVHPGAAEDDDLKSLFQTLRVKQLSNSELQNLILQKHAKTEVSELPAREVLVSHAVFLFKTKWDCRDQKGDEPFYVLSEKGQRIMAHQAYLHGKRSYHNEPCFAEFRNEFSFLHQDYYNAVGSEEKDHWFTWLQEQLGVQGDPQIIPNLQELIIQRHSKIDPSELPAQKDLISHAVFLFRSNWQSGKTGGLFWVMSETGPYLPSRQVYIDTTKQHSFGQYFNEFRKKFPFLHNQYYDAVEADEKDKWLAWLRQHLGVLDTDALLPKLRDLTVRKCSGADPSQLPPENILISHTVFLFRMKWKSKTPLGTFWFVAETGQYLPAQQIYLKGAGEDFSAPYFLRFWQEFPFLHAAYYHAVEEEEMPHWLTWLHQQFGLWDVPQLVDSSTSATLSMDFQRILNTWSSKEFLMLLSNEWDSTYGNYFRGHGSKTMLIPTDASDRLREKIGSAMASCHDGSLHPLRETFIISVLPKGIDPAIISLQPLLDIPEPQDPRWQFLQEFGVTVEDNVRLYLQILDRLCNLETRDSGLFRKSVSWLYRKVQEKDNVQPDALRKQFSGKKWIYIPSPDVGVASCWVEQNECVWEGAKFLRKYHALKRIYPNCEPLFIKILTHKHMDIEVLVSEAELITASTPLSLIIELFKEISKRENASQIDETLANRLLSGKIFPIDEGDAEQGFDDLCSGAGDMEWYIADRPHLRDSFRGVVSLLSFSPAEILTIMPLITALGFEDRLLSKRTASNLITRGDVHLHEEHTATFRAKSKFIGRLLPKPITSLGEQILAALDNLKVFVADEVLLEWTLTSNDEQKADRTAKSRHHDDGIQAAVLPPAGEKGIEFYLKSGSDSCLPLDVARRLANICGIEEQANLIYFIFSERNFSYIERYLDRQGLLALTKEVDGNRDNTEYDTGPAEEDFGDMDSAIPPLVDEPADGGENKLKDGESATSDPQQKPGTGQQTPTATDSAEKVEGANNMKQHVEGTDSAIDSQQAIRIGEEAAMDGSSMNKSYHPPPDEVAPPRPCYSWLGDHLEVPSAAALPRSVPNQPIPRTRVVNDAQRLTVLERPRIVGKPNVMFVSNPQELPREDFSEMAPGGNILPGRAQIDQSGSCTIIIATNPDTRNDSDAAFIGELFVSKLLEHHLGSAYHPETHWTSHLRKRAGHTPLGLPEYAAATFTLANMPAMTEFLIRASFKEAMLWREETPVYHIQVQTTVGGQDSPFILNATNFEMIRRLKIPDPYLELPKEVFILVRVSDICASSSAFFYVDPWTMYVSGQMRVRPEMDSYVAEIMRPKPNIILRDFGHTEWPDLPRQSRNGFFTQTLQMAGLGWMNPADTGASVGESRRFIYRPLTNRRTVRLLELWPGEEQDDLEGELHYVSLESQLPPFLAISYVWGYDVKPFVLKTSEGDVGLTASLCFGLRHLRQRKNSVLVWADAICIDQSNEQEKSIQVRLMQDLFKMAKRVCAWIGEEADGSGDAMKSLCRMAAQQTHPDSVTATLPDESAVWDSINKFFGRPWFQRVWIVQELVVASQVVIICGDKSVSWDDIYAAARICSERAQTSTANVMKHIVNKVSAVLSLGDLRLSYHKGDGGRRRLLTLFQHFHHTKATLQRDKLFALLGLASDALEPALNPDYSDSLENIVQRYARVFVERGNAMELLYHAGFCTPRFPSWIPDWITNTPRQTITTWPSKPYGFSACTQVESEIRLSSKDKSVLVAKGYIVDKVNKVGKTSFQTSDRLLYLQELSSFILSLTSYPTGESLNDLVWKIPIGDSIEPTSTAGVKVDFRAAYQAFTEYLQLGTQDTDWKMEILQARAMAKIKQFLFRPQELRQLLWPYLRTALDFAERFADARACITQNGYIGILPGTATNGDFIAVLHGSSVPFLIRKSDKRPGHYINLGECYIHGIMQGMPATRKLKQTMIRLH